MISPLSAASLLSSQSSRPPCFWDGMTSTTCSNLFSLCTPRGVICWFQWLHLISETVPKFTQLSCCFTHSLKSTSFKTELTPFCPFLNPLIWPGPGLGTSAVSLIPHPAHIHGSWLLCCYHVLWSPPSQSCVLPCASITSCLDFGKSLWTSFPHSQLLLFNLWLSKQTRIYYLHA